ncbi:BcepGomrgp04 [Burkholderia phage BcepGomr]|uniref:BcepGomrgp04 n=1 Tax=Burkholderia phage BcepGomr TaxID=437329 RepID=UPI0001503469|nr:BcepGomrgp04 [Burkholderia phage BcepGomr]ABP63575.1 BcepGomrgp04 [Burkholderia phage BcepGomr]
MEQQKQENVKVIWQPLPGSQTAAITYPGHHLLYEGTRGPGKTDAQLMKFRRYVGLGYGRFWRGIIFDREYKNLDDLVSKSQRWFPLFEDGAKFKASKSDYRWVWPTGEELLFRQIKKSTDYWNYHGQEFPFIGWNELSKYPTPDLYESMMSCNRSSFRPEDWPYIDEHGNQCLLPEMPLMVFSTTNPYGPGHNWVKRQFIDIAPPGVVVKTTKDVFNPRTQKREPVTKTQVRLFGSYKENIYLTPEYVAELESIKDPNKRKAWLHGDWNVVAGGAIDDLWREEVHVKPRFNIPASWRVDRSFDWGSTHPFYVGWWAEANGDTATITNPDGTETYWTPARGSLILFHEWYGTEEIGTNKGLKLGAKAVAKGIKEIEAQLWRENRILTPVRAGPADGQIYNVIQKDVDTIAKVMEDNGVMWKPADKSAGARTNGLQLLRDRLEASLEGEGPGIYFMSHCTAVTSTLPVLPRDDDNLDDVDTEAEDHPYDGVRYRCLASANRLATVIPFKFGT